jgi:hypothetical protein
MPPVYVEDIPQKTCHNNSVSGLASCRLPRPNAARNRNERIHKRGTRRGKTTKEINNDKSPFYRPFLPSPAKQTIVRPWYYHCALEMPILSYRFLRAAEWLVLTLATAFIRSIAQRIELVPSASAVVVCLFLCFLFPFSSSPRQSSFSFDW